MSGMATKVRTVKLTEAQMTALASAGIFDIPEGDDELFLAACVNDGRLTLSDPSRLAGIINDLSNAADAMVADLTDAEQKSWARKDSRVLSNLYGKLLKANA